MDDTLMRAMVCRWFDLPRETSDLALMRRIYEHGFAVEESLIADLDLPPSLLGGSAVVAATALGLYESHPSLLKHRLRAMIAITFSTAQAAPAGEVHGDYEGAADKAPSRMGVLKKAP